MVTTNAVQRAAVLIRSLLDFTMTGGNLHIVVDDGNLDDVNLLFCQERIDNLLMGDAADLDLGQLAVEVCILRLLIPMSMEDRERSLDLSGTA